MSGWKVISAFRLQFYDQLVACLVLWQALKETWVVLTQALKPIINKEIASLTSYFYPKCMQGLLTF